MNEQLAMIHLSGGGGPGHAEGHARAAPGAVLPVHLPAAAGAGPGRVPPHL